MGREAVGQPWCKGVLVPGRTGAVGLGVGEELGLQGWSWRKGSSVAVGLRCGDMRNCPTLSGYRMQSALSGYRGEGGMSTGGERGLLAPLLGCSESEMGMNCREKGQPAPFPGGMCTWEDVVLLSCLIFGSSFVPWGQS